MIPFFIVYLRYVSVNLEALKKIVYFSLICFDEMQSLCQLITACYMNSDILLCPIQRTSVNMKGQASPMWETRLENTKLVPYLPREARAFGVLDSENKI
jgi:hypothetical protein